MNPWKLTLYAGGSALLISVAYKYLKDVIFENVKQHSNTNVNEVLIYGGENEDQRNSLGNNNLYCIYYIVSHASRSVDVCVPSLVSHTLTKCLLNIQRSKDKKIRVAIHNSDNLSKLSELSKSGIEVKIIKSNIKMDHEFILIDAGNNSEDAVAIIGYLSDEINGLQFDRDTTVLTSDMIVILALKSEFERVWKSSNTK